MAGRIRSVKPELVQHELFATLSDGAARTYYGLLALVDDAGRCPAAPSYLAGQIFWAKPRALNVIARQITELETAGWVRRYSVRGSVWLEIVGWLDIKSPTYQKIDKRQPARFPAPESCESSTQSTSGSTTPAANDLDQDLDQDRERIPRPPKAPPIPSRPEPETTAEERERGARAKIRRRALEHVNKLRETVGAELGQVVRPLHPQDPGERGLLARQLEGASEADIAHVLDVAELEARTQRTVQWLTGAIFEERSWRRALGMTREDAGRPRLSPRPTEPVRLVLAAPDDDMPALAHSRFAPLPQKKGTAS